MLREASALPLAVPVAQAVTVKKLALAPGVGLLLPAREALASTD